MGHRLVILGVYAPTDVAKNADKIYFEQLNVIEIAGEKKTPMRDDMIIQLIINWITQISDVKEDRTIS